MSLGPVMLGIDALELSSEERELLQHPLVGGVILFSRNYHHPEQLSALVSSIHHLRRPQLLVAVDHEGGRVQRFREGFTRLPAVRELGALYEQDPARAKRLARASGWLMAAELRSCGVDFSFAPVLDLDWGRSAVIGDRAFHSEAETVAELAQAYMSGMQKAGMEAVGKHFPGHGYVHADSHHELPVDDRPYSEIAAHDLVAFERMVHYGLAGIMPAHVRYSQIDPQPAGFSRFWLQQVLRQELGFQGAIFSDDLEMAGAHVAGNIVERAELALSAGCDMLLCCNDRASALSLLRGLRDPKDPVAHIRLARFHGRGKQQRNGLLHSARWQQAQRLVSQPLAEPLLDLDI